MPGPVCTRQEPSEKLRAGPHGPSFARDRKQVVYQDHAFPSMPQALGDARAYPKAPCAIHRPWRLNNYKLNCFVLHYTKENGKCDIWRLAWFNVRDRISVAEKGKVRASLFCIAMSGMEGGRVVLCINKYILKYLFLLYVFVYGYVFMRASDVEVYVYPSIR